MKPSFAASPAVMAATLNGVALHERLLRYRDDPPEYGIGMSNHLPMVLDVLARAGASEASLDRFAGRYREKILAQPARGSAARRYEHYAERQQQFRAALESEGVQSVLLRELPLLLDCVEAAAFHCVIRLSHALRAGQRDEIANALAFWSICHLPLALPRTSCAQEFLSAGDWIAALHQRASEESGVRRAGLITDRFVDVTHSETYRHLAGCGARLPLDMPDAVREIGLAAGKLYSLTGNFTVLHVVTGTEALLHVLSFVDPKDAEAKRIAIFSSIALVFLAARPIEADAVVTPQISWHEAKARAMASDDEHVVKLVFSAANWNEIVPNEVWLAAARRALVSD